MPSKLYKLELIRWGTLGTANDTCIMTNVTLTGLRKLQQLKELSFKYCDNIFGTVPKANTFEGLSNLTKLDLGYSRIAKIEDGALKGLDKLTSLRLYGNQIGPRKFWAFNNTGEYISNQLRELDLQNCGILSDEVFAYSAEYIISSFHRLKSLDLSTNLMYRLPKFSNQDQHTALTTLNINANHITALSGEGMNNTCAVFPSLHTLKADSNRITTIGQLCSNLTSLHLMNNQLGQAQYGDESPSISIDNFEALSQLIHLTYLNLGGNGIKFVPNTTFHFMVNLSTLYLDKNLLVTVDSNLLCFNRELSTLDLSRNRMKRFDMTLIQNAVNITDLRIGVNLITHLDNDDFVQKIETYTKLKSIEMAGNPFDCSCHRMFFQKWVNTSAKLELGKRLICGTPSWASNKPVFNYTEPIFRCYIEYPLIIGMSVLGVVLLSIAVAVPCYRYRWYLAHIRVVMGAASNRAKDMKCMDECIYDAMICFNKESDSDLEWVTQTLLRELEGGDYPRLDLNNPDDRVITLILQ